MKSIQEFMEEDEMTYQEAVDAYAQQVDDAYDRLKDEELEGK